MVKNIISKDSRFFYSDTILHYQDGEDVYGYIKVWYNPEKPEKEFLQEELELPFVMYGIAGFFLLVTILGFRNV